MQNTRARATQQPPWCKQQPKPTTIHPSTTTPQRTTERPQTANLKPIRTNIRAQTDTWGRVAQCEKEAPPHTYGEPMMMPVLVWTLVVSQEPAVIPSLYKHSLSVKYRQSRSCLHWFVSSACTLQRWSFRKNPDKEKIATVEPLRIASGKATLGLPCGVLLGGFFLAGNRLG